MGCCTSTTAEPSRLTRSDSRDSGAADRSLSTPPEKQTPSSLQSGDKSESNGSSCSGDVNFDVNPLSDRRAAHGRPLSPSGSASLDDVKLPSGATVTPSHYSGRTDGSGRSDGSEREVSNNRSSGCTLDTLTPNPLRGPVSP